MEKKDVLDLNLLELEESFLELGLKKYVSAQVYDWLHNKLVFDFDLFSNISKKDREILKENFEIPIFKKVSTQISSDKKTVKFLFKLSKNRFIESVLLEYGNRYSICVSSQVGCPLKCDFCATGMMKFEKNLSSSEILLQFYYIQNYLKEMNDKISNVVFMGMGEPFLNYDSVIKTINVLNDKKGQNFSKRNFTISTSGLIDEIKKLADFENQVGLAISLHSVNDEKRSIIMPINKVHPLEKLKEALIHYQKKTNNRITFEYILIDEFNCSIDDAKDLARFIKGFNHLINLIPYNKVEGKPYKTPSLKNQREFYNYLLKNKINVTLRETKGDDIKAACGQLKIKKEVNKLEEDI